MDLLGERVVLVTDVLEDGRRRGGVGYSRDVADEEGACGFCISIS